MKNGEGLGLQTTSDLYYTHILSLLDFLGGRDGRGCEEEEAEEGLNTRNSCSTHFNSAASSNVASNSEMEREERSVCVCVCVEGEERGKERGEREKGRGEGQALITDTIMVMTQG